MLRCEDKTLNDDDLKTRTRVLVRTLYCGRDVISSAVCALFSLRDYDPPLPSNIYLRGCRRLFDYHSSALHPDQKHVDNCG